MIELIKNPKLDWIGAKRILIPISILLLLIGAVSVQLRQFNLGVDFSGGTLMTVRFNEPVPTDRIRAALASVGTIDTNKVTLQPVVNRPNELLIRAPQLEVQTEAERRVDADKRQIIRALQGLNPAGEAAAGRVNVNTIDAEGIEQELRQVDPLGINNRSFAGGQHPYRQTGEQVVALRNGPEHKGYIKDITALQALNLTTQVMPDFDQAKVKAVLLERLYAGKIDLNLAGSSEIEDALVRIDPLGIRGQTTAGDTYRKATEAIKEYRTSRSGVIAALNEIQVQDVSPELLSKMEPYFTTGTWAVISADIVGPQVGQDLRNRAIYVTLAALAGMLVYIAFRFEWIYGVAAVLAVFHDVMVTLGLFSLFQWEISLTVVAALLTLIGYSMNDTIVIFDRIRENLRLRRRDSLVQITNDSINETLSRTVITNGLTFVSVVAIVIFGGEVLRGFSTALTIGIIVGTYSTVAVASPIMLWWQYLTGGKTGPGKGAETKAVKAQSVARV